MTETEWVESRDPALLLEFLREKTTHRKLRMFGCACCKRIAHFLTDERSMKCFTLAEHDADTCLDVKVQKANYDDALAAAGALMMYPILHQKLKTFKVSTWYAARAAGGALMNASPNTTVDQTITLAWASGTAAATDGLFWDDRVWQLAARPCRSAVDSDESADDRSHHGRFEAIWELDVELLNVFPLWHVERAKQAQMLRDCIGNPFRSVASDADWLTWNNATVPKLAQLIYDESRFGDLPILADALEEAGCSDHEMLAHCRQPGDHVRGCWVVDLVLGKK